MVPERIARHFHKQAASCERLGSSFTANLCRMLPDLLDERTRTGQRIAGWPGEPGPDALALRLCGALHFLVLSGRDADLVRAYPPSPADPTTLAAIVGQTLGRHDELIANFLDSPPQTNEVGRSAMLLPGFLAIARSTRRPLALCEIGASAGLNLVFDRFSYRYGDAEWGDADSTVRLRPDIDGTAPPLDGALEIVGRAGCDIAPVNLNDDAARMRLLSYVWPDQHDRLERARGAIALARTAGIELAQCDAAAFLRGALAARPPEAAFVLFHSIMWQYMPQATQAAITTAMAEAGEGAVPEAPVAWLRMEPGLISEPFATLSLTLWPGGETHSLARCDYHGRWIDWIGAMES
ncbi:MAG: DUF2332 family protein [Rhizobiaceae bacterium]|nr:DUF2332 family protein [Rhizobiaceae bacterium]MCV0407552.1 DUF2332 family protein [Rhizobiaceae bacterium]